MPTALLVGGSGTSLVRLSGRGVGLLSLKQNAEESQRGIHHLVFWRSPDGGETWERPVQVTPPGLPAHAYQDVLLRTSSGRIVVPVYGMLGQRAGPGDVRPPFSGKLIGGQWVSTAAHFFDPRFSFVYVCYSDDDGRTWQRNRRRRAGHPPRLERDLQLRQRAERGRGQPRSAAHGDADRAGAAVPVLVG